MVGAKKAGKMAKRMLALLLAAAVGIGGMDTGIYARTVPAETETSMTAGDDMIENWSLGMDYSGKVSNIWNAAVSVHTENYYVIKNAGYNANILKNNNVSFGFELDKVLLVQKIQCRILRMTKHC